MLLKTRKYPKYLNDEIIEEISEKWFSVYNYISLQELVLTARRDFLNVLSKINLVFWILTIIIWIFSYYSWLIFILPFFLFFVYFFIFLIIFFKLLYRTKLFLYITDVVYTKIGLMISDDFLYYKKNSQKIDSKLEKYNNIFDEYLSRPSNLEEIISKKKKDVLWNSLDFAWSTLKNFWNIWRSKEGWALMLVIMISLFLYVVSLYIFYYFWYFFLFILSKIYIYFLKIVLSFKDKVELKIKKKTLQIDSYINKMNKIYEVLKNKIDKFKSWEISSIDDFVEDKFRNFYTEIDLILKEKEKLKKIIESSKYSDFIDFDLFKKYLKKNFNKPVEDMISLLKVYEKLLNKQILEIEKLRPHTNPLLWKERGQWKIDINNTEILNKNLETKWFVLDDKLRILEKNKKMLERSILR